MNNRGVKTAEEARGREEDAQRDILLPVRAKIISPVLTTRNVRVD